MTEAQVERCTAERGAALLFVLVGTAMLSVFGLGLMLLAEIETTAVWNSRGAHDAFYASEGMAAFVIGEISALPSWTGVLNGSVTSAFRGSLTPTTEYGDRLDLTSLTLEMEARLPRVIAWGLDTPRLRLFAHGPASALGGAGSLRSLAFVIGWVADDGAEQDGDSGTDGNGVVTIVAMARGVGGAARTIQVSLARVCPGEAQVPVQVALAAQMPVCTTGSAPVVRVLSWREIE